MSDFIDFETAADDGIVDNEIAAAAAANVSSDIDDFIDDETQIHDNLEDYYAFTNVSRSVEDAMQGSYLEPDGGESLTKTVEEEGLEASNYDNCDPIEDETDGFTDSTRWVGEFKHTLFCPQGAETPHSFCYAILYDLRYKKKNIKDTCDRDDQLKQDIENDKFFEALSKAKVDLRLNVDIQNFENQCFLVNSLLNEKNLFLRVYKPRDKFRYLIKHF